MGLGLNILEFQAYANPSIAKATVFNNPVEDYEEEDEQNVPEDEVVNEKGIPLSIVLRDKRTGLRYETHEDYEKLKEQTSEYLKLRRLSFLSVTKRKTIERCRVDTSYENPFCPLLLQENNLRQSLTRHLSMKRRSVFTEKDLTQVLSEDLTQLTDATVGFLISRLGHLGLLTRIAEASLKSEACPSGRLLASLGFRTEQEFPNLKYQELAVSLYKRALECGTDDFKGKAGFRLALIYIWQKKYVQAEHVLAKLIDKPEASDYQSRLIYWRYYCAVKLKNEVLQSSMKNRLSKEYPLGFHTLLVSEPESEVIQAFRSHKDPLIFFRSVKAPRLNGVIAAAEILQKRGELRTSIDLLSSVLGQIRTSDLSFQIYVATLFSRAGDFLNRSQLLVALFKENPAFISKETLSLLYPLEKMSLIRGSNSVLDPYLVISLIRQESAFNARAQSRAGALGLMQLMPRTAKSIERVSNRKLFDPTTNIRVGVKYFSKLLKRFDGDIELALAAYNAGSERVSEWVLRYGPTQEDRILFLDLIPYKETREYVASIVRNYYWYTKLYQGLETKNEIRFKRSPALLKSLAGVGIDATKVPAELVHSLPES